jgi:hypothetical protein
LFHQESEYFGAVGIFRQSRFLDWEINMNARIATLAVAAIAVAWPTQSFALAALAAGALTSCKITATNPIQRQIQVNADPFAVTSFGLSMLYDTDKLTIVNIIGLNGYSVSDSSSLDLGVRVFGYYEAPNPTPPLVEVDVYGIIFRLNDGLPLDTILDFHVSHPADFINAIDPATGETRSYTGIYNETTNPNGLRPSFDRGTVLTGSIIPEPTGLALIALPAIVALRRTRRI